jgi:hypothetical protein
MSSRTDHLESDDSFEPALASFVNDPHPSLAQHAQDFIARDLIHPGRGLVCLVV